MEAKKQKVGNYEFLEHTLEPIYDENSKILILGSFPSVKSRENNFYYAHLQNRFWKVLAYLTKEKLPNSITEKKELLLKHNIALWDVINSCQIIGSSDSSIKEVVTNDLQLIIGKSSIEAIYTNGGIADKLYKKYLEKTTGITATKLPSTSPANARYSLEKLEKIWQEKIKKELSKV